MSGHGAPDIDLSTDDASGLRVELQDGTTFIGIVRGEQADSITFTTASGASIAVRREQTRSDGAA